MVFDSWYHTWRVVVAAIVGYVALVAFLRFSGKRTLAKLNAFDLVVTVALGSTLATIALSSDVSLLEGVVALATLISLQFAVAWSSVRWSSMRSAVKSRPALVVSDGRLLDDELRRHRLHEHEVFQALRSSGVGDIALVAAVVLETDGTLSVVTRDQTGSGRALVDAGWEWPDGDGALTGASAAP